MTSVIIIFIILSFANVIFGTYKSIVTINGNKWMASFVCAAYCSFYNIVLIYTVAEFDLILKCAITFVANLVGVFIVKLIEEKHAPVKLWKIELALHTGQKDPEIFRAVFRDKGIECNYSEIGHWYVFNCYCETKEQTKYLKEICKQYNGRMSAYESANL